jgi:hypothetical protein
MEVEFAAELGPLEFKIFRLSRADDDGERQDFDYENFARVSSQLIVTTSLSEKSKGGRDSVAAFLATQQPLSNRTFSISNSLWELKFDRDTGFPIKLRDKVKGGWSDLKVNIMAYDPVPKFSGAYGMKFQNSTPEEILAELGKPRIVVTEGSVTSSVRTQYKDFANVTFVLSQAPDLAHAIHIQVTTTVKAPNFGPHGNFDLFFRRACYQKSEENNKSCRKTLDLQICFCSYLVHDSSKEATELAKERSKVSLRSKVRGFYGMFHIFRFETKFEPIHI